MRETYTARLLQKTCISESSQCFHMDFAVEALERFDFVAGQFISAVTVDPNGKTQTRAYSIASASNGNHFDMCVNRVEGGFFSNFLADMSEGETVQVHGPHGHFTLRAPMTDSIFVATGTGIAPMRGFTQWLFPETGLEAGLDRSEGKQIWLVYGTRWESEIYYREYFDRIASKHPNFHYLATLSRAPEEWKGLRGYVQQYVGRIVEHRGGAASGEMVPGELPVFRIHTYICGLNNMVSGVRDLLAGHGWHRKQIIFERYD